MFGKQRKDWSPVGEYETDSSRVANFLTKGVRVAIIHPKEGEKK